MMTENDVDVDNLIQKSIISLKWYILPVKTSRF